MGRDQLCWPRLSSALRGRVMNIAGLCTSLSDWVIRIIIVLTLQLGRAAENITTNWEEIVNCLLSWLFYLSYEIWPWYCTATPNVEQACRIITPPDWSYLLTTSRSINYLFVKMTILRDKTNSINRLYVALLQTVASFSAQ